MPDAISEREVRQVARAEQVLLWSMRAWYASECEGVPVRAVLSQLFAIEGIAQSLPAFDRMMRSMFNGLIDRPEIRCLHSEWMGRQERQMLSAIAVLQQGDEFTARRFLRDWLNPSAVGHVVRHARSWAEAARAAHLLLESPTSIGTRPELTLKTARSQPTNVSHLH